MSKAATYLLYIHRQVSAAECPKEFLQFLLRNENPATSQSNAAALVQKMRLQQLSINQVFTRLALDEKIVFNSNASMIQYVQLLHKIELWLNRIIEINEVIAWNNLSATANEEGLQFLIAASSNWEQAATLLKTALQKSWYEYLVEQAVSSNKALRKFERASHEEVIEKFRKLDVLNLQYNRARVALRHWENLPRQEAGGQVSVLRNEFNKRARHMPIRKLMQQAGLAIQAIKPVFMMSPLSIANFLPPGSMEFDLVIFDEASQVRPVEALGALLRGRQLVVVVYQTTSSYQLF